MYCKDCGLPRGIGKANRWGGNGIIASRYENDMRGAFYDVDELNHLFAVFSERIGFDISRLVVEGKRKDSALYTRKLLRHIEESGAQRPLPEDFFRAMAANFSVPGFGRVEVLDFAEDGSMILKVGRIYSRPMAEGQAAGVFEAVLNRRAAVRWEGGAEEGRIHLRPIAEEEELEQRISSEVEKGTPEAEGGGREYELCPGCGAPLEVSREFDWNIEEATITERRTGKRFIFDNVKGLNAVVRAIIDELGEEVESLIADISRLYARAHYRGLGEEASPSRELARFPLRGWGFPADLRESGGGYELRILNPLYAPITYGRAWGLLENASGADLLPDEVSEEGGVLSLRFSRRVAEEGAGQDILK